MIQVPEISKLPTAFKSMDFAFLRSEGIRHLEQKGSRLWTDYNLHDPGITILEVLCYAITDLGYRTNFAIEDIIAEPGNGQKQFFGPLKILPCNPVTPNDFRKILIDIKGIKNAWLFKTVTPEVRLYGNDTQLSYTSLPNGQEIMLNGLYDVYIDLEDDINQDDEDIVNDIIQCAWQQLWKHRNLCEDFVRIALVRE